MGLGLGLGIQFNSLGGMVSKILTWGKSIPARFWGTTTPEYWGGLDAQAQVHYNRVIADGGVVPAGLGGVNSFFQVVKGVYGTSDINTAISAAYDPHYLGYKLGAGSGTTLGQAAQKMYAPKGIFGGIGTGSAYWEGVNVGQNNVVTPDAPANRITGDVDIICYLLHTSNGGFNSIVSKNDGGTNRAYNLTVQTNTPTFYYGAATLNTATATANITSGSSLWLRVTRNATNGEIRFFTSNDASTTNPQSVTWTQLGATVSGVTGSLNSSGTLPLIIGGYISTGSGFTSSERIFRLTIANSIGGAPVVDFNANQYTGANTWTSTTGEVWTVNSTGAGLADVTQTTAASQPLLLAHTGENYWFGSGVNGNYCIASNTASNITGDIEVITKLAIKDLTQGTYQTVFSKYGQYMLEYFGGNGLLYFYYELSGGVTNAASTVTLASVGIASNQDFYLKITRVASSGLVTYSYSLNGTSYTQLGATISNTSGAIINSNIDVYIGTRSTFNNFTGKIHRVSIANSIGGTPVVDFNPSSYNPATSQTQWTSATGEVWTINTGTANTGYKGVLVTKSIAQMDGIDDTILTTATSIQTIFNSNNSIGFCGTVFANTNDDFIFGAGADYALNNSYHFWIIGTAGFFPSLATQGTILSNINTSPNATSSNTIFTYTNSIIYGGTSTLRVNQINKTTLGFNNTTNKPNITSGNFGFSVSGYNKHGGQIRTFISSTDATKFVELDNFIRSYNNL